MNTAILLCATMLAADNPAQVKAKVLYVSGQQGGKRADIEVWIRKTLATFSSAAAIPHTSWIALTGDSQTLYRANGLYIDGKASERDGKYKVEIDGCDGAALGKTVTLKPGERRIVNVADVPGPNNLFVALEAPIRERASKRAKAMKADVKTFRLELHYSGEQGKPFYSLVLSVPAIIRTRSSPFERNVQVKEDEAINIIDYLARDSFLDSAIDFGTKKIGTPTMPGYSMKAMTSDVPLYADLGWDLPMVHRLDALREVLPDNGKREMDLLLGRLTGLRKQWEVKHPPFEAQVGREDSQVKFLVKGDTTIIDIASKFGIDKATIKRESPTWPKSIIVRLHLTGLELFNVSNGELGLDWSVSSTGDNSSSVFLRSSLKETALDTTSPYYTTVSIVGGNEKIPLKDGYFKVRLPETLFKRNPQEIRLEWIDFYRN